jgi:putative ABC transport system substrate-binding protein
LQCGIRASTAFGEHRGDPDRANELAEELVVLGPDVIVAASSLSRPLARRTRTIPIVFVLVSFPIAQGYVPNMARPEGNLSGFTNITDVSTVGKLMQLLKEILPNVSRVALMIRPEGTQAVEAMFRSIEAAAASLGVEAIRTPVGSTAEIESAIVAFARTPNSGMIALPDNFLFIHRELIIGTVARHRLPTVYPYGFWAREGGLIGYGNDVIEPFRLAAAYVDRILRGANVGELPVQQPIKFELMINRKTAKALGLTAPPTLLVRADEVIE